VQDRRDAWCSRASLGAPDEVLVVLERVVLEVVLAQDADAVEVALREVLEAAGLARRG
jgi:hypothetical protein